MTTRKSQRGAPLFVAATLLLSLNASADEGMWPFQRVPSGKIQEAHGSAPSQQFLNNLRLSSVRLNDGGSGSFVCSASKGLLLTNHHVAMGQIQKASDRSGKNYVKEGFFTRSLADEFRCDDLEVNVLQSVEDVTGRVNAAVRPGTTDAQADEQRKIEISRIEKESLSATGLRSDVVPLYGGGEYWIYRYKKFTDVRLVMAPEAQAAHFGGDPDNFTYPRYALDFAFFRVYENGVPYETKHCLPWSATGIRENELTYVSGHPGRTQRSVTLEQLETIKDLETPAIFDGLARTRKALLSYGDQGPEQRRQATGNVQRIENSLKAFQGRMEALNNPAVMETKARQEKALRAAVEADPILRE